MLAARDRAVLTELQTLAGPWMTAAGLMSQEIESFQQEMEPWLTLQEARTQVYAAIVTAPFELGEPLSLTVARASIDRLISRKRDLHSWLLAHRYELIGRASDLLASHGMRVSRPDLPTVMFEHIARSAMFTTLMTDEFRTQVNRIRIDHPIEFDFAQDLCEYLESLRKDVFLEHELCALYVIGTGLCSTGQSLAILLLCGRRSLESVNRAMLENTFDNVTVTSVYDVQSAEREYGTGAYSILIRDDSFADKGLERLPWNLVCRGILSDADLAALKRGSYGLTVPYVASRHSPPKSPRGVCGADADLIVARNLLRGAAAGAAQHGMHARELLLMLKWAAQGKLDLPIIGESTKYAPWQKPSESN